MSLGLTDLHIRSEAMQLLEGKRGQINPYTPSWFQCKMSPMS